MKSVLALITILFLITSSIPFGFTEIYGQDVIPTKTSPIVSSTPKESRNILVSLHESVGITSNAPQKKVPTFEPTIMSTSDVLGKTIFLSERLDITSSILEQTVQLKSFVVQPQATLDRVSQIDKVKDRKKNSKVDSVLANEFVDDSVITTSDLLLSEQSSIDPIINQWTVSLEKEDGGFQEAHASQEPVVKVKYRYHSETITVFSN